MDVFMILCKSLLTMYKLQPLDKADPHMTLSGAIKKKHTCIISSIRMESSISREESCGLNAGLVIVSQQVMPKMTLSGARNRG